MNTENLHIYIERTVELLNELDAFKEELENYDDENEHKNKKIFDKIMNDFKGVIDDYSFYEPGDWPEYVSLKIGFTLDFIADDGDIIWMTISKTK